MRAGTTDLALGEVGMGEPLGSTRLARGSSLFSRAAFALTFLLAMMSPAWEGGTFARLPVLDFRLGGQRFQVGVLALLPGLAALAWALARLIERPRRAWRWGPAHVLLPLLLFSGWALIRTWPVHVRQILAIVVVAVSVYLGTYLYVLQEWPERWCVTWVAVMLALQAGIAVAQFVRQGSVGLSWLGEGWLDPEGQGISVIEAGGRRWLRAYGMMAHPNLLGGYLGMSLLVCLGAIRSLPGRLRPFFWAAIGLGAFGITFSFSRSAWLGTAVGLVYLAWVTRPWRAIDWRSPRVQWALLGVGALLVATGLALGIAYGELLGVRLLRLSSPLEATSIRERLEDYRQAWGLIRAVPLKGVGSGYYIPALWAGVGADRPPGFRRVHNAYLLAAAELGVVGALLWVWALLAPPAILAWRARRQDGTVPGAGWAAAFVCALVLCLFDSYLYVPSTWWAALFLGLLAGGCAGALGAGKEQRGGVKR
jgi:O-antigen ligase